MLVRLESESRSGRHVRPLAHREEPISRARLTQLTWIVGVATAFFVLWGLWRYGIAADAAARWPVWLADLLGLFSRAGLLTLAALWGLILWQRRAAVRTSHPRLSVDELYALSPRDFEHFVAGLFERRGYTVEVRGRSGDLGVDLALIRPDGRPAIVQCKRYRHQVGPDVVRELFGTMVHERAAHGFLVTTAETLSDAARQWAADKPITLIDGETLAGLSDRIIEVEIRN